MDKKVKLDLIYYLMVNCDMINGRIMDMTKEDIDDTWFEEDFDEIIDLGQRTCSEFRRDKNHE